MEQPALVAEHCALTKNCPPRSMLHEFVNMSLDQWGGSCQELFTFSAVSLFAQQFTKKLSSSCCMTFIQLIPVPISLKTLSPWSFVYVFFRSSSLRLLEYKMWFVVQRRNTAIEIQVFCRLSWYLSHKPSLVYQELWDFMQEARKRETLLCSSRLFY